MRTRVLMAFLLFTLAAPAAAGWEAGGGLEYFTVRTYLRDADGRYFQTLLQTTLATAAVNWRQGPWSVEAQGAFSNWNDFGEWQGTYIGRIIFEDLWAWQQRWQVRAAWEFTAHWKAGLGLADHQLRQYDNQVNNYTFMHYRLQDAFAFLTYDLYASKDFSLDLSINYAPYCRLEFYQAMPAYQAGTEIQLDAVGLGQQLGGGLHAGYWDSAGWGVDVHYQIDYAWFNQPGNLAEAWMRSGRLTGVLRLDF
jgi:hypothetical protein